MKSKKFKLASSTVLIGLLCSFAMPATDCCVVAWEAPNRGSKEYRFPRPDLPPPQSAGHPKPKWIGSGITRELDTHFNDSVPSEDSASGDTTSVTIENHLGPGLTDSRGNDLEPGHGCIELEVNWYYKKWVWPVRHKRVYDAESGTWTSVPTHWEWDWMTFRHAKRKDVCETKADCN